MPFLFKDENALVSFVIKQKLPDWQVKLFKRNAEAVQVHSQGQIFYKLDRLFPNEDPRSKDHRVLAFESVTEASFGRAANNINRIFKNSSYTCEASERTIDQVNAHNYGGQNFFNWFLDQWVKWSLKEDPNARIAFYPPEYVKMGKPPVAFISSEHLKRIDDELVIFVSEAESEVKHELEEVKIRSERFYDQSISRWNVRQSGENTYTPVIKTKIVRAVYHAFFRGVGFYRIEQDRPLSQKEWTIEFFPFGNDALPVTDVGGECSNKGINKSFLHPFVAFGNLALLQHSQHTAVNFTFSFPRMAEVQGPCDDCDMGWIECDQTEECPEGRKACKKCGGTGHRMNQSPYNAYIKKVDPQGVEGDNEHLKVPYVEYYTPETSILDYSKKEWKEYLMMAEQSVYVKQRVMTGNVESAEKTELDNDDLYSFLTRVAHSYFGKLRFGVQCFENFTEPSPMEVSIPVPYSFAILTEGEAYAELKDILASNVPTMLKANRVEGFVNKFVSQSSPIRRFLDVLRIVDPLLYYNSSEVTAYKMNGAVTGPQFTTHVFAYPVLQKLYYQDKNLFLQDTRIIIEKLEAELKSYEPKEMDLLTNVQKALGNV